MGTIASEAELIDTYLAPLAAGMPGALGLKDDAAYLRPPPGTDLIITTDPVIAGIHFFPDQRADDIAWKALAVNVSDLAAKGAAPLAYSMALAFPGPPQHAFMAEFARGLADAQAQFGCSLIGGDTDRTTGPLSISITVFGVVPSGRMVQRTTAAVGDHIFVTGTLGDAALGLALQSDPSLVLETLTSGDRGFLTARYLRPAPRLELAPLLREHASAALDISDGFAKDLGRLLAGAGGKADMPFAALPLSSSAQLMIEAEPARRASVIAGGDDYEILFTVPPGRLAAFRDDLPMMPFNVTEIGTIQSGNGISIRDGEGIPLPLGSTGWDHFTSRPQDQRRT
jgi:thiamine-monophosphate kinase